MRHEEESSYFFVLTTIVVLTAATAASAGAQTFTIVDTSGPRASLRLGTAGRGLDWDTSIDSPLLADYVRFRGSVGRGRWHSEFGSPPDPRVTRLAASALVFIRTPNTLKPYVGLGFASFNPSGTGLSTRTGMRLIGGMELPGERWTVGLEGEIDLPRPNAVDRPSNDELYPDGRIGLALRRRF